MIRYYENNIDEKFKAESDFVYRKRNGTLWQTAIYYLLAVCIVVILFMLEVHTRSGGIAALVAIVTIMGALALHSIVSMQKHLDLVTSIEFQNALFSSAFRNGKLFSLIISQEDQLYYADPKFYKLFPNSIKNSIPVLDTIIAQSENAQTNMETLNYALTNREACSIDVYIDVEQERELVRISIMPLPRPSGYFFVSARFFQINRSGDNAKYNFSREDALKLLEDLFANKNEIAYLLDNNSELIACTDGFAKLIGVGDKTEIIEKKIVDYVVNAQEFNAKHFNKMAFNHEYIELKNQNGKAIPTNISHFYIHNYDNSPKITLGKVIVQNQ